MSPVNEPSPQTSPSSRPGIAAGLVVAGKYQLLHMIGEGGMGAVWAATHLGLNQVVALKIISSAYANSHEARSRFDHEAKAAARLKSRYVVQVFDNGELPDGTPYMAMELLEGESLAQRLARGPLTLAETSSYLGQIARAVDRAHELGIIHRDLKPENIFLARSHDEESGLVVKVLDFGIAKISMPDGGASHTRTGVLMGTPLFMSPEQARGLKTLDHRTDLYSLGLVVFTMLTGRKPFGGESLVDLVVQVCTFPLPSFVQDARMNLPALDLWLQRTCNRDPSLRFSTARELAEAFAVAANISAARSGGSLPGWDPSRPNPSASSYAGAYSTPGPSNMAGPSNMSGPSNMVGPSNMSGPSNMAGPLMSGPSVNASGGHSLHGAASTQPEAVLPVRPLGAIFAGLAGAAVIAAAVVAFFFLRTPHTTGESRPAASESAPLAAATAPPASASAAVPSPSVDPGASTAAPAGTGTGAVPVASASPPPGSTTKGSSRSGAGAHSGEARDPQKRTPPPGASANVEVGF